MSKISIGPITNVDLPAPAQSKAPAALDDHSKIKVEFLDLHAAARAKEAEAERARQDAEAERLRLEEASADLDSHESRVVSVEQRLAMAKHYFTSHGSRAQIDQALRRIAMTGAGRADCNLMDLVKADCLHRYGPALDQFAAEHLADLRKDKSSFLKRALALFK